MKSLFARLLDRIRSKSIIFSAVLMLVLVLTNGGFLVYNNRVLERTTAVQAQTQEIKELQLLLWNDVVRNIDVGVRGYAILQDEGLLNPYENGLRLYQDYHKKLYSKLQEQGYPGTQGFLAVKQGYDDYLKIVAHMLELAKAGNMDEFRQELKQDRGLALWKVYEKFSKEVNTYQDKLYNEATEEYQTINALTTYIQLLLLLIGVPTLIFMIFRISHDSRARKALFVELERNNREYIFNPGTALAVNDEREVINSSILNFKKAAKFISEISAGNLEVDWEELSDQNKALNQQNLTGELINMREKMKKLKEEDSRRMWATEGQARFSEIIRTYQHDLQSLCYQSLAFIVKYLGAQQGGVFVLREEEGAEKYLELTACYAFDRKKWVEKRVAVGQGLVGQIYLEQEAVMIKEIPQAYTHITSGLGDATPHCLLVVPMMYNKKVEAVIEVAGFKVFEPYQLEWLEKVGEIMASTLISIKTTETTRELLEQFKEQTEQLTSQEEELRQNMEELEATQEEMRRKEQELERRQAEMQRMLDSRK
ncbi:GAF domain-containing protein [Cesiribacter sp. SM1]|uniref:GAF domain-containing protein n=1 Tax=Cesiribacter sp. SM1 TaxID=2861196 RepID=UPI001CD6F906|nr:GAF domain-containing protein [Cesiribacter sp. SM1]